MSNYPYSATMPYRRSDIISSQEQLQDLVDNICQAFNISSDILKTRWKATDKAKKYSRGVYLPTFRQALAFYIIDRFQSREKELASMLGYSSLSSVHHAKMAAMTYITVNDPIFMPIYNKVISEGDRY